MKNGRRREKTVGNAGLYISEMIPVNESPDAHAQTPLARLATPRAVTP